MITRYICIFFKTVFTVFFLCSITIFTKSLDKLGGGSAIINLEMPLKRRLRANRIKLQGD